MSLEFYRNLLTIDVNQYKYFPAKVKNELAHEAIKLSNKVYPHLTKEMKYDYEICHYLYKSRREYFVRQLKSLMMVKIMVSRHPNIYFRLPDKFKFNSDVGLCFIRYGNNMKRFMNNWNRTLTDRKILRLCLATSSYSYELLASSQPRNYEFMVMSLACLHSIMANIPESADKLKEEIFKREPLIYTSLSPEYMSHPTVICDFLEAIDWSEHTLVGDKILHNGIQVFTIPQKYTRYDRSLLKLYRVCLKQARVFVGHKLKFTTTKFSDCRILVN